MSIVLDPQSNKCMFCGSDKLRKLKARAFDAINPVFIDILECSDCVFAWQYPLSRSEKESKKFFEEAYAEKGPEHFSYFDPKLKREIAKLEFDFLSELPGKKRAILDIGAGAGIFAEVVAENGLDVTAVDPAIDDTRLKNNHKVTAVKGTIEQISCGEIFDVVTLWDVIEHAKDPIGLITSAKRHLREGGWLIIETGNYKGAERVYGGLSHWIYQLDHRWYFSPKLLRRLLINSGFHEFVFADKVLRPGWDGQADYAGPTMAHFLKLITKDPLRLPGHISKFISLTKAKEWERPGMGIFTIAARNL